FPRRQVVRIGLVLETSAAAAARARLPLVGADIARFHHVADLVLRVAAGIRDDDVVDDAAVFDFSVRGLYEPELVDPRVARPSRDEADVRPFRRLDRADAAVVRRVHVADFEPGALAREAARPEGRETPLVRDFRQRVRLVHE